MSNQQSVESFYTPGAVLFLDNGGRVVMRMAKRASIQRVIAALPTDWRFTKERPMNEDEPITDGLLRNVERDAFRVYLEQRLAAFQNDDETLDEVERRAFGYRDQAPPTMNPYDSEVGMLLDDIE